MKFLVKNVENATVVVELVTVTTGCLKLNISEQSLHIPIALSPLINMYDFDV